MDKEIHREPWMLTYIEPYNFMGSLISRQPFHTQPLFKKTYKKGKIYKEGLQAELKLVGVGGGAVSWKLRRIGRGGE
jgi:hypothetical protein